MEKDQKSANQLHVLPEDWESAGRVIGPLLQRLEADGGGPAMVVLTGDAEAAVAIAGRLAPIAAEQQLRVLAATEARRAARVQRAARAQLVVSPPSVLLELVQSTAVKLDSVRCVVLAWVDDLEPTAAGALETVMADLPKESTRVVLAHAITPGVEQLVDRYARRARRVQVVTESLPPISLSYVAVGETGRVPALRRILDALDPESAYIVTSHAESRAAVAGLLRSLGYGDGSLAVRVGDEPDTDSQLVILFDLPASEDALRRLASGRGSTRVVALVTPRQIPALRRFAGGTVAPMILPEAAVRAQSREDRMREELRSLLATGQFSRELLALQPLLSEYDGIEIAAAAVRLLEAERLRPQASATVNAPAMTRLFLNVGEMDNVRPADLVGAITSEAGISKAELGKVEVRERFSTVEVATPVANTVISKITGVSIRGRRVLARVDADRERSPGRERRDDVRLGGRGGGRRPRSDHRSSRE